MHTYNRLNRVFTVWGGVPLNIFAGWPQVEDGQRRTQEGPPSEISGKTSRINCPTYKCNCYFSFPWDSRIVNKVVPQRVWYFTFNILYFTFSLLRSSLKMRFFEIDREYRKCAFFDFKFFTLSAKRARNTTWFFFLTIFVRKVLFLNCKIDKVTGCRHLIDNHFRIELSPILLIFSV